MAVNDLLKSLDFGARPADRLPLFEPRPTPKADPPSEYRQRLNESLESSRRPAPSPASGRRPEPANKTAPQPARTETPPARRDETPKSERRPADAGETATEVSRREPTSTADATTTPEQAQSAPAEPATLQLESTTIAVAELPDTQIAPELELGHEDDVASLIATLDVSLDSSQFPVAPSGLAELLTEYDEPALPVLEADDDLADTLLIPPASLFATPGTTTPKVDMTVLEVVPDAAVEPLITAEAVAPAVLVKAPEIDPQLDASNSFTADDVSNIEPALANAEIPAANAEQDVPDQPVVKTPAAVEQRLDVPAELLPGQETPEEATAVPTDEAPESHATRQDDAKNVASVIPHERPAAKPAPTESDAAETPEAERNRRGPSDALPAAPQSESRPVDPTKRPAQPASVTPKPESPTASNDLPNAQPAVPAVAETPAAVPQTADKEKRSNVEPGPTKAALAAPIVPPVAGPMADTPAPHAVEVARSLTSDDAPALTLNAPAPGQPTADAARTTASKGLPTEIDRQEFLERVTAAIRQTQPDARPLRVRLNPPELGSLQIEVSTRGGAISARLEVQNVAAQQTLLESMSQLRDALVQHGTPIDRIDVQLTPHQADEGQSDSQSRREQQSGEQSSRGGRDQQDSDQSSDERPQQRQQPKRRNDIDELDIEV